MDPYTLKSYEVIDSTDNTKYTVFLSSEEFERAQNDPEVAAKILENAKIAGVSCDLAQQNKENQETAEESENPDGGTWTRSSTLMFMELYAEYESSIANGKLKQKTVFQKISEQLTEGGFTFSAKQCASKLTSMKRMYKKIKDHNSKSGNDRQTWQYYDQMHDIFGKKPWIKPLSTLSSTPNLEETLCDAMTSSSVDVTPPPKRMKISAADKYLDQIMQEKALARKEKKECHEAKMKRWDKMNEVLEKIFRTNENSD